MTTAPTTAARETYAGGLIQAFEAVADLAGLTWDLDEQATVRASITVHVRSEAEVDAAAALMGTAPERDAPGHYRAVKRTGAVTVSVAYTADPGSAPADLATIGRVCERAACTAPGSTS